MPFAAGEPNSGRLIRGSVVYLLENRYLFSGDSLAWSPARRDLTAFRDACWYSWKALKRSLARLVKYRFE